MAVLATPSPKDTMDLDIDRTFGDIYQNNGAQFTCDLYTISNHTIPRAQTEAWANKLRFLTPFHPSFLQRDPAVVGIDSEYWVMFGPETLERRELYLTSPGEGVHHDYLAISYRWDKTSSSDGLKPYEIIDNGQRRTAKAPLAILDRAIKHAASKSMYFIWIDKECIDQDDRNDKELGIQSMDRVYRRAKYTVGLLNIYLEQQADIDLLIRIIDRSSTSRRDLTREFSDEDIDALASVFQKLDSGDWFQRTWILQEIMISGKSTRFSIRCGDTLQTARFGGISGEIELEKYIVQDLVVGAEHLYDFEQTHATANTLIDRAKLPLFIMFISGDEIHHSNNNTFNASAATSLMDGFKNTRVADRLAIVANFCNYDIRLNTTDLSSLNVGYSVCLLALALLNGDLSLLHQWSRTLYDLDSNKVFQINSPATWQSFSWGPSNKAKLLNERGLTRWVPTGLITQFMGISPEDIPNRLEHCSLVTTGLKTRVWLWKIEGLAKLADIRSRYLESWTDGEKFQKDDEYEFFFENLLGSLIASGARNLAALLWWWGIDHHGNHLLKTLLERFMAKQGRKIFEIFELRHIVNVNEISGMQKDLQRSAFRKLSSKIFKDSKDGRWILTQIMTHGFLQYGTLTNTGNHSPDAYCMFKNQSPGFIATTMIKRRSLDDPLGCPSPIMHDPFVTNPNKLISWKITRTDDKGCAIWKTEPLTAGIWAGLADSRAKGCDIILA